jgi:hypothetical protein
MKRLLTFLISTAFAQNQFNCFTGETWKTLPEYSEVLTCYNNVYASPIQFSYATYNNPCNNLSESVATACYYVTFLHFPPMVSTTSTVSPSPAPSPKCLLRGPKNDCNDDDDNKKSKKDDKKDSKKDDDDKKI